jgi:hypothetical protein
MPKKTTRKSVAEALKAAIEHGAKNPEVTTRDALAFTCGYLRGDEPELSKLLDQLLTATAHRERRI